MEDAKALSTIKLKSRAKMASPPDSLNIKLMGVSMSATGAVAVRALTFLIAWGFLLFMWVSAYHSELLGLAIKAITKS